MQLEGYQKLSEEQLLRLVREENEQAVDCLLERYKPLVRKKARALFLIGGERDDLIQEGMIGLYKAIRDYNERLGSPFYSFADLCITRQIYNAIKQSNRKKNIPLNYYLSFYEPVHKEGEEKELLVVDVMFPKDSLNPEEMIVDKENTKALNDRLNERLSKLEKDVIHLYIKGIKYTEIAILLKREPKTIDNAIQRVKNKLSEILKEL